MDPLTAGGACEVKRAGTLRFACEACHLFKVRCDGAYPCQRCRRTERICSRRSPKIPPPTRPLFTPSQPFIALAGPSFSDQGRSTIQPWIPPAPPGRSRVLETNSLAIPPPPPAGETEATHDVNNSLARRTVSSSQQVPSREPSFLRELRRRISEHAKKRSANSPGENNGSLSVTGSAKRHKKHNSAQQRFACPFHKLNPHESPDCGRPTRKNPSGGWPNVHRVK
jgi:hypothetical protein